MPLSGGRSLPHTANGVGGTAETGAGNRGARLLPFPGGRGERGPDEVGGTRPCLDANGLRSLSEMIPAPLIPETT